MHTTYAAPYSELAGLPGISKDQICNFLERNLTLDQAQAELARGKHNPGTPNTHALSARERFEVLKGEWNDAMQTVVDSGVHPSKAGSVVARKCPTLQKMLVEAANDAKAEHDSESDAFARARRERSQKAWDQRQARAVSRG